MLFSQLITKPKFFKKSNPSNGCVISAITNVHVKFLRREGNTISSEACPLTSIFSPVAEQILTGVGCKITPDASLLGNIETEAPVSIIKGILVVPNLATTSRSGGSAGDK